MQAIELKTTLSDLDSKIYKMFQLGARLVVITGNDLANGKFELIYHFSKGAEITNIKVEVEEDQQIESVTGLFPYADLMESELLDYFGIKIDGARPFVFLEEGSGILNPLRKERKPAEAKPSDQKPVPPAAGPVIVPGEVKPAERKAIATRKLAPKDDSKGGA